MGNASGHQCKVEINGSGKKKTVHDNTCDRPSIKGEVSGSFTF